MHGHKLTIRLLLAATTLLAAAAPAAGGLSAAMDADLGIGAMQVIGRPPAGADTAGPGGTYPVTPAPTAVLINDVPKSDWLEGCAATSAAMAFGYYDRNGYPDMYTGSTNGGVAPLFYDDAASGFHTLSYTAQGEDGRATRGHSDDYWIAYTNANPDPYITNGWVEHDWADCAGDFLGTNQSKYGNTDGSTTVYSYTSSGNKLVDYIPPDPDGTDDKPGTAFCHGLKLFAESRGYSVTTNYTQRVNISGGFTFNDYMAQIDAGRPVFIHVTGHTMLGVGYNESDQTIYLHNTWGNYLDSMIFGGNFLHGADSMAHQTVTVLELAGGGGGGGAPEPATLGWLSLLALAKVAANRRRDAHRSRQLDLRTLRNASL